MNEFTQTMNGEGMTKKTLDAYIALGKQIYDHGHKERGLEVMANGMAEVENYIRDRRPTTADLTNPWNQRALVFEPSLFWDLNAEKWYASIKTKYGSYAKEYQSIINYTACNDLLNYAVDMLAEKQQKSVGDQRIAPIEEMQTLLEDMKLDLSESAKDILGFKNPK